MKIKIFQILIINCLKMIKWTIKQNIIINLKNYIQIRNENIYAKFIYIKSKWLINKNYKLQNYKSKN